MSLRGKISELCRFGRGGRKAITVSLVQDPREDYPAALLIGLRGTTGDLAGQILIKHNELDRLERAIDAVKRDMA